MLNFVSRRVDPLKSPIDDLWISSQIARAFLHFSAGEFVPDEGSDIAEASNSTHASEIADIVAEVAKTDSVEACALLGKLVITVATGWLIF